MFFSFASVVRHFPNCALDFSHSSFEISPWALATQPSTLRFPAYQSGAASSVRSLVSSVFPSWAYWPICWPFCLYTFPVFHGCNLRTLPFNSSLSSGSAPSRLLRGFRFWLLCYPAVTIAAWTTAPGSRGQFSLVLPESHLPVPTLFQA